MRMETQTLPWRVHCWKSSSVFYSPSRSAQQLCSARLWKAIWAERVIIITIIKMNSNWFYRHSYAYVGEGRAEKCTTLCLERKRWIWWRLPGPMGICISVWDVTLRKLHPAKSVSPCNSTQHSVRLKICGSPAHRPLGQRDTSEDPGRSLGYTLDDMTIKNGRRKENPEDPKWSLWEQLEHTFCFS